MKTEIEQQMYATIATYLPNLSQPETELVKALCRASYKMGFDHGKATKPTLELINADEILTALNQKTK